MQLGYHTICWGGVVGEATGVTSVKDLYYRTPGSMADSHLRHRRGRLRGDRDVRRQRRRLRRSARGAPGTAGRCRPRAGVGLHRRQLHLRRPARRRTPPGHPRRRTGPAVRRHQPRGRGWGPAGRRHHGCGLHRARRRSRPGHRDRRTARAHRLLPPAPVDHRREPGRAGSADAADPDRLLPGHRSPGGRAVAIRPSSSAAIPTGCATSISRTFGSIRWPSCRSARA